MNALQGAARLVGRSAETVMTTAGAVGGAVSNGVVEGLRGAVQGAKSGLAEGPQSTPAAVLAFAAVGAAGLVEWPVVLGVGATALVLRRLTAPADEEIAEKPRGRLAASDDTTSRAPARASRTAKSTAKNAAAAARKTPSRNRRTPAKSGSRS